jgi:hypothetical protein
MLFHVTPKANGYFENVWGWVADHDLDDAQNTMVTVAVARGFLIESEGGPTWLYGTASEHCMLYQYNFYNTANLFAGMIQTESPYFQHTDASSSPGPFKDSLGVFNNDPEDFSDGCEGSALDCAMSWAAMFSHTTNVTIAGAGLYSWFDAYDQSVCVDVQNCQQRLIYDQEENGGLWIFNLVTIGAVEMISSSGGAIETAKNNTQANAHPFWSALALWGDESDPVILLCDDDDKDCPGDPPCDLTLDFADLDALGSAELGICQADVRAVPRCQRAGPLARDQPGRLQRRQQRLRRGLEVLRRGLPRLRRRHHPQLHRLLVVQQPHRRPGSQVL